jgi:hypothetical protein
MTPRLNGKARRPTKKRLPNEKAEQSSVNLANLLK